MDKERRYWWGILFVEVATAVAAAVVVAVLLAVVVMVVLVVVVGVKYVSSLHGMSCSLLHTNILLA